MFGGPSAIAYNEARSVIFVGTGAWAAPPPTYIEIDGLRVTQAHPNYSFTNAAGQVQQYSAFGACIWIERGQNVVIADNELTDCSQGLFSRSLDYGDWAITKNIRMTGNTFLNNGIVGDEHEHHSYIQSAHVVYEFNHYGALRAGALGNAIKDRSTGTVVRYNRIEDGAHAIDLVEAEDWSATATADPAYRLTYVYGNEIVKDGSGGTVIHYGGDHIGNESFFRAGTLYVWQNTIHLSGSGGVLFQLSTTLEQSDAWNNIFVFDSSVQYPSLRASQDVAAGYTSGGVLRLGTNWADSRIADSDPWHPVAGTLSGLANLRLGTGSPVDGTTLVPLSGSAVIGTGQQPLAAVGSYPVSYQLTSAFVAQARPSSGTAIDMGALAH